MAAVNQRVPVVCGGTPKAQWIDVSNLVSGGDDTCVYRDTKAQCIYVSNLASGGGDTCGCAICTKQSSPE